MNVPLSPPFCPAKTFSPGALTWHQQIIQLKTAQTKAALGGVMPMISSARRKRWRYLTPNTDGRGGNCSPQFVVTDDRVGMAGDGQVIHKRRK